MKMRFLKLPVATILSMGLLLTVATGTTLASEEGEGGSFGDHQEMVVSVYDGDVVDFSSAVEPENLSGLKKMVKSGGEDDTIQVSAETLSDGRITISRPVNLYVDGYDSLSGADQDKVKLVIDLPDELEEDAARVMTIQGLPEECVLVRNLGPVSYTLWGRTLEKCLNQRKKAYQRIKIHQRKRARPWAKVRLRRKARQQAETHR